jgi:UDP-N-acetylmuramoyl-L-alanyl-D-glutamate--2,6-diaminopimelate ligase
MVSENFILWTHKVRAMLAALFYGYPAKNLKVIGVTGTNGKTTACHFIASIFEEAGFKVAMATTIDFKIASKIIFNESKMTTLSPFFIQKFLRDAVNAGCQYAIIETTSHALKQHRVWGIKYHGAVLTNITHDHLDYHKNFKDYQDAKLSLFSSNLKFSVLNVDDESYGEFSKVIARKNLSYGIENKADIAARKIMLEPNKTLITVVTPNGQVSMYINIPGKFNVYNALSAISVGIAEDLDLEIMKNAIEKVTLIPGRMEKVEAGQDFTIIVDFAHTPDGLQKIFEATRAMTKGKIIHVGGATGNRDKTKRPIMGSISGRWADVAIVTDEDPYDEDPKSIIDQVADGVIRGATKENPKVLGENFFKILNRKSAIMQALNMAKKGDVVLITGKGAETKMAVGNNQFIPWNDKEIVEEGLGKKGV